MPANIDHANDKPAAGRTDALPPRDTKHWVASRKAQVVTAVQRGLLSLDEALVRYRLSLEEFVGWQRGLYRHGLRGLQVTHLQLGRASRSRAARSPRNRAT